MKRRNSLFGSIIVALMIGVAYCNDRHTDDRLGLLTRREYQRWGIGEWSPAYSSILVLLL